MHICYLKHADIDKEKWDKCIADSVNALIYPCSYYLDIMSKNWDALIIFREPPYADDYLAVMPLTWNKKFGISYLRQPAFTQQLGIFGDMIFDEKITDSFIRKALEIFPFAEINLNYANDYKNIQTKKCNLILPLNRSFIEIKKTFRKDFVNKIRGNNLIYQPSDEIEKAVQLFKDNYHHKLKIPPNAYHDWLQLCTHLQCRDQVLVRKVYSAKGQLLSMAMFLKDKRRIYYVMSTTLPAGRKQQSNYFLLYHVIKEFAGQDLIFDFEGSDIPSIKLFFSKFGSVEQPYPFVKINNLSFLKKWLKKGYDYLKK
ncbi:MAG: GNAT family N-acetyltransferase [Ginsengibacter sp.]